MQRRPPRFALPVGVTWHPLSGAGELRAGGALNANMLGNFTLDTNPSGEWAYITSLYRIGLRASYLRQTEVPIQLTVARSWFHANYVPFLNTGQYFGFGPENAGFDGPFAPEHWSPGDLLKEEFEGLIQEANLEFLVVELQAQAAFWMVPPDLPRTRPASPDGRGSLEETSELLDQAQEKAEALPPRHGDIGHNQGPRLVDEEAQRRLEETIKNAFAALAKGKTERLNESRQQQSSANGKRSFSLA